MFGSAGSAKRGVRSTWPSLTSVRYAWQMKLYAGLGSQPVERFGDYEVYPQGVILLVGSEPRVMSQRVVPELV
jgi:hypothetical protein